MTEFKLSATFDAVGALAQLDKFITMVNLKSAEASAAIMTSLQGGTKPGKTGLVATVQGDLTKAGKLSQRHLDKAAAANEKAAAGTASVMGGTTADLDKYTTALTSAIRKWADMGGALSGYALKHKSVMDKLGTEVKAYGDAIEAVAAKLGISTGQLAGSLKAIGESNKKTAAAQTRTAANQTQLARSTTAAVKQQQAYNRALAGGVDFLNQRLTSMHAERGQVGRLLADQQARVALEKTAARTANDDINKLKRQGRELGNVKTFQTEITRLEGARNQALHNQVLAQQQVTASQARMKKLTNDVSRGSGGISRQLLFAATNLANVVKRVILWSAGIGLIFGVVGKINQSLSESIKLQSKLVQIAKIKPTGFDVTPLKEKAVNTAVKYGIAVQEIAETMRVFAQQGKNTAEIIDLIDVASKGVVATNLTMHSSVELLTAAMNIFGLTTGGVEVVLDKIQKVQANFAVTAESLSEAIRLLGPVIRVLGSDMDYLLGSVTAVAEATRQTGKFVANALKTIFARLPKKDSIFLINSLGISLFD